VTDQLLTPEDRKEQLSLVYVRAVAARAGYLVAVPKPDRDSVDLRIQAGGPRRPALDLQIKATASLQEARGGARPFRLSRKNYDDLRVRTQTPRLLVVFEMPRVEDRWVTLTNEELVLRRCCYWASLQGGDHESTRGESVTVHLPDRNRLTASSLRELMARSAAGDI